MNRGHLRDALKHIALGFLVITFNFNLGSLNILPDWVGFALIGSALPVLGEEIPSSLLLRPLCTFLLWWEVAQWGMTLFGITYDITALGTAVAVASLYFYFQLLTNLAELAERVDSVAQQPILTLRNIRTVLITLSSVLLLVWPQWLENLWVAVPLGLLSILVAIKLCMEFCILRDELRED